MARHARSSAEGNWDHVFNRGARRWPIFQTDDDRRAFVGLLQTAVDSYGIEIHGFCLMGNHYHLVTRAPKANLSRAIGYIGQMYTQQFNHHHEVDGPLFRGRFGSEPITDDRQLLTVIRYVARNPLDISEVDQLADYHWSSHRSYLGLRRPPSWLHTDTVLEMLNGPAGYRSFVEADRPEDTTSAREDVILAVMELTDATHAELFSTRRHHRNDARLLLVLGLVELAGMKPGSLVGSFGFTTASTVRSAARRARDCRQADSTFAETWQRLRSILNR